MSFESSVQSDVKLNLSLIRSTNDGFVCYKVESQASNVSVLDFQAWVQIQLKHIPGNVSVLAHSISGKDGAFQLNEF